MTKKFIPLTKRIQETINLEDCAARAENGTACVTCAAHMSILEFLTERKADTERTEMNALQVLLETTISLLLQQVDFDERAILTVAIINSAIKVQRKIESDETKEMMNDISNVLFGTSSPTPRRQIVPEGVTLGEILGHALNRGRARPSESK